MAHVNLQASELHRQNLEWGGQLNRASSDAQLFSLYLAMHLQPGNPTIAFEPSSDQANDTSSKSEFISHYRRAATQPDQNDIKTANIYSKLTAFNDTSSVMLWRAMHPDPLSVKDDHRHVAPEVLANCSYATQQRWRSESPDTTLTETPVMLDEVIRGSESLLI
ncbi:VC2046/SO_2500 family protein [Salinimonas chungwhensis]|uniref:VC2046/SO_2500 family protein n=1 Tax=Salinimonas chungwhensis TaxID=265425 RepID=UPI00037FC6A2|nr:VC2046/SO_2500 family protein [Salinimonas chungwhensis]